MRTIKERQLKEGAFSMDPMRLMSVIDQQVESNNVSLFERVIDKEIFDKVFKGVRTALIPQPANLQFDVSKLLGSSKEQSETELSERIRDLSQNILKQMNLIADEDEES